MNKKVVRIIALVMAGVMALGVLTSAIYYLAIYIIN